MAKLPSSSASAHGADVVAYGLDQLLELAGERLGEEITPRTVRLYATEGLIDRPGKDGRRALYGQRHLLQLLLVRTLARRGLSLSAIAPLVAGDDEALQEQLSQLDDGLEASTPARESNDALDYLQSIQSSASEASPSL
ncbi:MAG: MerR family transcriptional regulator, partial [Cyanobacteria bacterium K_DeepCast_35m_m1_288]|nr:MerR family transcriptional regulator [Cyanobacteria bacterium K_DeepCast_35m_m1_288]